MHNRISENTPRVYALCRVSSKKQVLADISIPEQRAAARRYRKEKLSKFRWGEESYPETEANGFFVDRAVSAWKKKFNERPAASRLLSVVRPGDYVLIYSVDRAFRNVGDFGTVMQAMTQTGVNVIFVSQESVNMNTSSGKLIGNMLATIAQYSSDVKSDRAREAKLMRKLGLVDKNKPSGEPEKIPWDENKLVLPGRIEEESKRVPGRVFPYIRCSHVKSLESGLGLACQEQAVVAYSQQLKEGNDLLEIQDVFADEAVSAFSKSFAERPSGRVISEQLKTGDHVVVYRLDRAWRSLGDATQTIENWISNGIHVHLVADGVRSDDPFGRLHFYTMAYISWVESYLTSCRSKAVAAYLKKKGRPAGNTPYLTKKIVKNNKKQLVLDVDRIGRAAWFKDLKERTGMTYEAMAEYIAREYAKRSGKKYKMTEHPFDFRRIEKDVVALPKMLETAAANMADVPTPEELHSRGVIKYML